MLKKTLEYLHELWYYSIRIGYGERMKYSALNIAKYVIYKSNEKGQKITQLKLQKILYFIEAYFMATYDRKELYKEDFYAWLYGPMIKEVYNKYKVFMSDPIPTDKQDLEDTIYPEEVVESVDVVLDTFGKYTARQLIQITHMEGSPWAITDKKAIISKTFTREWFEEKFLVNE